MQTIETLFADQPMIQIARPEDNDALLKFNRDLSMSNNNQSISYDRGDDFFSFYKMHSEKFWCFKLLNSDSSIGGFATLIRQEKKLNGQIVPVGYFCDLRISPKASRRVHVGWRQFYKTLVSQLPHLCEEDRCVTCYTAIFDGNTKGLRTLTQKLKGIAYTPLTSYQVQDIVLPIFKKPVSERTLFPMIISDTKAFQFIQENTLLKSLSPIFNQHYLEYMQKNWLHWDEFPFLAISDNNEILAVVKPYRNDSCRKIRVQNLTSSQKALSFTLRLMGRPKLSENTPLHRLEMTNLTFKVGLSAPLKQSLLKELVQAVKTRNWLKTSHSLAFTLTDPDFVKTPLNLGVGSKTHAHIFEVHPDHSPPLLRNESHIFFEGAIS